MARATLDLPMPPSVNVLWRHGRGKTYRSSAYERWRHDAGWSLLQQRPERLTGWDRISIAAGVPDRRRRDLDNLIKALLELLVAHQVIEDDAHVGAIEARWDRTAPAGRVLVEVRSSIAPARRIGEGAGNRRLLHRYRPTPIAKVPL